ncbi:MAG: OmpH family outer membrane protein [Desulfatibacillaceae bacterium]
MHRITRITLPVLLILFLALTGAAHGAGKVGFINLKRLVNESDLGKTAKKDIAKLRKDRTADATEKQRQVNHLKQVIEEQGDTMSPEEKREKLEALQKTYKDYQRLIEDAKEDIAREDRELVSIILKKADDVLKEVAKKRKYTIILKDPATIGYLDPEVDITDEVLKELDRRKN